MELLTQITWTINKKACLTEHSIFGEVKLQPWYIVVDRSEHYENHTIQPHTTKITKKIYCAKSRIDSTLWRMMRSWLNIGLCVLYVCSNLDNKLLYFKRIDREKKKQSESVKYVIIIVDLLRFWRRTLATMPIKRAD